MALLITIGLIIMLVMLSLILDKISTIKATRLQSLEAERTIRNLTKENYEKKLLEHKKNLQDSENLKNYYSKLVKSFDEIIKEKCDYYPQLAAIMADLLTAHYIDSAKYLETKKSPALNEAMRIRQLKEETKVILKEKKELEYKLNYILIRFPTIDEIFGDEFVIDDNITLESLDEDYDRVKDYLSKEDYLKLSVIERNQRALDNYIMKRQKSKWQVGRDYELYNGYMYSKEGYHVEYFGIIKKLEDLGRDLIARKENETLIIQCKNWSNTKTIHEKHIFQLYGTIVLYKLNNNNMFKVRGVFITSTTLSEKAKEVAKFLDIEIIENRPLENFPRIKCNINKSTGEKIYHLPFDQQYDSTVIKENLGEFMALTVAEAEEKGFRRAFKHYTNR